MTHIGDGEMHCGALETAGTRNRRWNILGGMLAVILSVLVGGQSRADETLVLQGANPKVTFDDNSVTPQLWELIGDHTGFDVFDFNAGTAPFHIAPTAADNSLFIDVSGLTGFGTDLPQVNLHVSTTALLPRLRLQSTSGSPCSWDLRGSAAGFDLLDVAHSGVVPFSVQANAPTNTLFLASSGSVGLGTATPSTLLHARQKSGAGVAEVIARFDIADDPLGSLQINNASSSDGICIPRIQGRSGSQNAALIMEGLITTDVGVGPAVVYNAAKLAGGAVAVRPLVVYRNNNVAKMTVGANGDVTATSFSPSSSRSIKDNIVDLDSQRAHAALQQLTPVEYVYKDDPTAEHRVGFIAEDVPAIVSNADRKSVPIMDVVALVTQVVKDQQKTIESQRKALDDQKQAIDELMKRLTELESNSPKK